MRQDAYLYYWNYTASAVDFSVQSCGELGVEHARQNFGPRICISWTDAQSTAYWDGYEGEIEQLSGRSINKAEGEAKSGAR